MGSPWETETAGATRGPKLTRVTSSPRVKQEGWGVTEGYREGTPSQWTPRPPGPPGTGTWCCWLHVSQRSPLSPGGQVQRPVCGSQWPPWHWQPVKSGTVTWPLAETDLPFHAAHLPSCGPAYTHVCSPAPGTPSGRGRTRGTGVLRYLVGNGTAHSGGGTQSPQQPVHRHKGGSPDSARSQSVLPTAQAAVTPCPAPLPPALETQTPPKQAPLAQPSQAHPVPSPPRSPQAWSLPTNLPGSGHSAAQSHLPYTGSAHSGDHRSLSHTGSSRTLQKGAAVITARGQTPACHFSLPFLLCLVQASWSP
jgi:hypothetical protein